MIRSYVKFKGRYYWTEEGIDLNTLSRKELLKRELNILELNKILGRDSGYKKNNIDEVKLDRTPICCHTKMKKIDNVQSMMHSNQAKITEYVCFNCGRYITLIDDQMDEEELDNIIENYGE